MVGLMVGLMVGFEIGQLTGREVVDGPADRDASIGDRAPEGSAVALQPAHVVANVRHNSRVDVVARVARVEHLVDR